MKKRIFAVVFVLCMLASVLSACGGGDASSTPSAAGNDPAPVASGGSEAGGGEGEAKFRVGITVRSATMDANCENTFADLQAFAAEAGLETVALDAEMDVNKQQSQFETLIGMDVDCIIVRAVDKAAIVPALKMASDAGIPVVAFVDGIEAEGLEYIESFIGADSVGQGRAAAEALIEYFEAPEFADKEEIKVLEVQHVPGSSVTGERTQGFAEGIEGSRLTILEQQSGEGNAEKAMQVTENWLNKYAPGEIDALYCHGNGMMAGIVNAITAAGRTGEFPCIGIAMSGFSYDYIQEGKMWGSVMESPHEQAQLCIDAAVKVLNGETIEPRISNSTDVCTIDNVDTVERPDW